MKIAIIGINEYILEKIVENPLLYDIRYIIDANECYYIILSTKYNILCDYKSSFNINKLYNIDTIILCHYNYDTISTCLSHGKHVCLYSFIGISIDIISTFIKMAAENNVNFSMILPKKNQQKYINLHKKLRYKSIKSIQLTSTCNIEDISHDIAIVCMYMDNRTPQRTIAFEYLNTIQIMIQYDDNEIVILNISQDNTHNHIKVACCEGLFELESESESGNDPHKIPLTTNIDAKSSILIISICDAIKKSLVDKNVINFSKLRHYENDSKQYDIYNELHTRQTVEFVDKKRLQYNTLNNAKMTMKQALRMMDEFIDESDPDLDLPNSVHAYQTAERIRKLHPNNIELQICGLIHDIGKVLFKFNEPGWAIVGDTFPVGCKFAKSIVLYDTTMHNNPDNTNPQYNTKYGIYEPNCGLKNVKISFGHDEYLYLVLKQNKGHRLSEKYWDIIRFHSLYPWHTGGDYHHLMDNSDHILLEAIRNFNNYDLYSKEDSNEINDEIKEYYDALLDNIFPEQLLW